MSILPALSRIQIKLLEDLGRKRARRDRLSRSRWLGSWCYLCLRQTPANNERITCNHRGGREYNYVVHNFPFRGRLELLLALTLALLATHYKKGCKSFSMTPSPVDLIGEQK
jgi:hypothetical protein